MKPWLSLIFIFLSTFSIAQTIVNGNFQAGNTGWGCSAEVGWETTYGGSIATNRTAEIDIQAHLCQTISGFTVGDVYIFSFDCTKRTTCGPAVYTFSLDINNGALPTTYITKTGSWNWQPEAFCFVATSTSHTINFEGITSGTCGDMIDNLEMFDLAEAANLGASDTTLCQGDTLVLSPTNISTATYLWQDNSTNASFNVTQAGTYWVQITVDSCTASDTIVVTSDSLSIDLGNDTTICFGDSLLLHAALANASFVWQDQSIDSTFLVEVEGTYYVDASFDNCHYRDTISVDLTQHVDFGNDTVLCPGESILLDVSSVNATYLWQDSSANATYSVTEDGLYWVHVTEFGCHSTDTFEVDYVKPIDLGNDSILCPNASYYLDATSPSGTYVWSDNSTLAMHFVDQPGSYSVIVTNGNCTLYDTIQIEYVQPLYLGKDTTLCPGENILLDATTQDASYQWKDGLTSATYTVTKKGLYWVELDIHNCLIRDTVVVDYIEDVDLGDDTTLCPGEQLTLDATTTNGTYLWQNLFTHPTYNVIRPGTYWTEVHAQHCFLSDTVVVDYFDSLRLPEERTLCPGETLLFDVSMPGGSYLWQDSSTLSSMKISAPGLYWANVMVSHCKISDTVHVLPYRHVDLGADTVICTGDELKLKPNIPNATYRWQDLSNQSSYTVQQPGSYWVEVLVEGCAPDTDSLNVALIKCGCTFYLPSAFTPNSDNLNDAVTPKTDCDLTHFYWTIFDRWGIKVFESYDPNASWDGRFKGSPLPHGVYAYRIHYKTEGANEVKLGHITLLRE